jgi:hypothetical protein
MPDSTPEGALTTNATAPITPDEQARLADVPLEPPERPPYDIVPAADLVGLRAVREMLVDLQFPMTTRQVLERAGQWRVPITGAHFHPLWQFLEGVRDRRHRDVDALVRAMGRAHPDLRP